jgi:hypothetical protein
MPKASGRGEATSAGVVFEPQFCFLNAIDITPTPALSADPPHKGEG